MSYFKRITHHWLLLSALMLWAVIPWLYFAPPEFMYGTPIALIALGFLVLGLACFCVWVLKLLNGRSWIHRPPNRFLVIFSITLSIAIPYFLSPLAPSQCAYKSVLVTVANAQGQNCTTTCTNSKAANCSGWSSCFNKNISCINGKDQDGRPCLGCCFDCKVVCDTTNEPPTITAELSCGLPGNSGWCRDNAQLKLTVFDPQGYSLTVTGLAGSLPISCAGSCTVNLPAGSGAATYTVTAAVSGLTASGSTVWSYDPDAPAPDIGLSGTLGSNGWYVSSVHVTAGGTDLISGIASTLISVDGMAASSAANITADGIHAVDETVLDNAGNSATDSVSVKVDTTDPQVTSSATGMLDPSGWYSSAVQVSASASDATSGLSSLIINVDGAWSVYSNPVTLGSGTHTVQFRAADNAGNVVTTIAQIYKVDITGPLITPNITGTNGTNGWYLSNPQVSASTSDSGSGVSSLKIAVDGGAWQNYTAPVQLMTNGIHTVQFQAVDNAGNSAAISLSVKVDTTAPVVNIGAPSGTLGSNGWYVSTVQVSASASDATSGLASLMINLDGTWSAYSSAVMLGSGTHTVQFRATDNAGNVRTSASQSYQIDATDPVITTTMTGTSGSNGWYVSSVQASASASDAGSGVASLKYAVDGAAWQAYSEPVSLSDGQHTVQFLAADSAGNTTTTSVTAKVDTTAPQITSSGIVGTVGSNGWYVSSVQYSASASDATSGIASFMVSVDGTWSVYSGAVALGNGTHTIQFRATDHAGKVTTTVIQTFQIDTGLPLVNASVSGTSGSNGWYISNAQVSASASDTGSGISSLQYALDGGVFQNYTASISLTDGQHTIQFQAIDSAGNLATTSISAKVDTAAPQVTLGSVVGTPGLNGWYVSAIQVSASASDGTSGLASLMAGVDGTWSAYSNPITLGSGTHTVQFRATDNAGNIRTSVSQTYKVDVTVPAITSSVLGTYGANGWHITDVTVDGMVSDAGSGPGSLKFSVDGGALQAYSTPIPLSGGLHTIQFQATDLAGNSTTRNVAVKVDTLAPLISKTFSTSEVGGWYAKAPLLTVSGADAGSGLASLLVLDNGVLIGSPITLTDGIHNITVTASDTAGNSASDSFVVRVDTTPPIITPSIVGTLGDHGWYVSSVNVNAAFSDVTSDVASTATLINGSLFSLPYALAADDEYTVIFNAFDKAGNTSSLAVPIKVDTTPPVLEVSKTGTSGKNGWYVSDVDLHITATDATSTPQYGEYRLDGGLWKAGMIFTASGDGAHTAEVRVFDQAGNVSTQSEALKIDATAPMASFLSPAENTPVSRIVQFSGTASDAGGSGLDSVELSLDGGSSWKAVSIGAWMYDWDITGIPNGIRSARVRAEDAAGNVSDPSILNLLLHNSGPYISLADPWSFDLAGELKVLPNVYDVKTVSIKVTNGAGVTVFSSHHTNDFPSIVWWNGQYHHEQQPAGEYVVLATACDLFGLCSTAKSAILIPAFTYEDPPKPPVTPQVIVSAPPIIVSVPEPVSPIPQVPVLEVKTEKAARGKSLILFLAAVALALLFLENSMLDPRPRANFKLANTIQKYTKEYSQS